MTPERFNSLMKEEAELTDEEFRSGWHFCCEFDGLLVKGDPSQTVCGHSCVEAECGTPSDEVVEL